MFFNNCVCAAVKRCGWANRVKAGRQFGFYLQPRSWRMSDGTSTAAVRSLYDNGRKGWRQQDQQSARACLNESSTETSSFLKRRRRDSITDDMPLSQLCCPFKIKRALARTFTSVWQENVSLQSVSLRTWLRNCSQDEALSEYRKTKRQLDICNKCFQWDTSI